MEVPNSKGGTVLVRVQPLSSSSNQLRPPEPDITEDWEIMDSETSNDVRGVIST